MTVGNIMDDYRVGDEKAHKPVSTPMEHLQNYVDYQHYRSELKKFEIERDGRMADPPMVVEFTFADAQVFRFITGPWKWEKFI